MRAELFKFIDSTVSSRPLAEAVKRGYVACFESEFPVRADGELDAERLVAMIKEALDAGNVDMHHLWTLMLGDRAEETRIDMYSAREFLFDNKWFLEYMSDDPEVVVTDQDVPRLPLARRALYDFVDTLEDNGDTVMMTDVVKKLLDKYAESGLDYQLKAISSYLATDENGLPYEIGE